MRGIRRRPVTMLTAATSVALIAAAAAVPATATAASAAAAKAAPICTSAKHPFIAAKISAGISAAIAARPGSFVGLDAADAADGLSCQLHETDHFYAASVIKVTILSALLMKVGGPSHLTPAQRNLAFQMITQSSNSAAQTLWEEEGISAVQNFLNKAGMSETVLNNAWGLTRITPHDELRLMQVLTDSTVLNSASRAYVLKLMSEVIASERWGVSESASASVTVHIKNGWLPYPGAADWNINSIGAFTGNNILYQMAILTAPPSGQGQSEGYGIETIEAAAAVFNKDLATWSRWQGVRLAGPDIDVVHAPGG
jgi:hypothetical protein